MTNKETDSSHFVVKGKGGRELLRKFNWLKVTAMGKAEWSGVEWSGVESWRGNLYCRIELL